MFVTVDVLCKTEVHMNASMRIDSAIGALVQGMLPASSGERLILMMSVKLEMESPGWGRDARLAHLMFHRPKLNTRFMWNDDPDFRSGDDFKEWRVQSDSPTLWRTAGLNTVFEYMTDKMMLKINPRLSESFFHTEISFEPENGEPMLRELNSYHYDFEKSNIFVVESYGRRRW